MISSHLTHAAPAFIHQLHNLTLSRRCFANAASQKLRISPIDLSPQTSIWNHASLPFADDGSPSRLAQDNVDHGVGYSYETRLMLRLSAFSRESWTPIQTT